MKIKVWVGKSATIKLISDSVIGSVQASMRDSLHICSCVYLFHQYFPFGFTFLIHRKHHLQTVLRYCTHRPTAEGGRGGCSPPLVGLVKSHSKKIRPIVDRSDIPSLSKMEFLIFLIKTNHIHYTIV